MDTIDRNIIDAYTNLFDGLSFLNKIELIERLSKSLKVKDSEKNRKFYRSFGAFESSKSAEEIITDIKSSRKFKNMEISF